MESVQTALHLMKKNWFVASIDLRDAYYSIPISQQHQKYLKFNWQGQLYQFTCLPNELACAPRIFTKILKPVYATLRQQGHMIFGYIDDSYLQGANYTECEQNVNESSALFEQLGFILHDEKSATIPAQQLVLLGFVLNSVSMTVSLTSERSRKLKVACEHLYNETKPTIHEVAHVVGLMVASFLAVPYAQLYYRSLEIDKCDALRNNQGNFDAKMTLSYQSKQDLLWWAASIEGSQKSISQGNPDITIYSDASLAGWGAHHNNQTTGGRWNTTESEFHINQLELLAATFALKSFCADLNNVHVGLKLDNVTAITYINNMGGSHSKPCNDLAMQLWLWCIERNIWVTASHVPGVDNIIADKASREFNDATEWAPNPEIFKQISQTFFQPEVDLFASRLNHKVDKYFCGSLTPKAFAVDALTLNWSCIKFYAFPPFSLIGRILHKMEEELAEGILVIPRWTTQAWFPQVMRMLVANPRLLTKREGVVFLPSNPKKKTSTTGENEPDGLPFIRESFQNQGISKRSSDILISAWRDGTQKQNKVYLKQWRNFCSKWKIDPLLDIKNITVTSSCCILYINGCLKHTRPGTHQAPLEILTFA